MAPTSPPGLPRTEGSRLLRRFLIAVGLVVGIGLLGDLALTAWKASVDRRLDAGWRKSLGGASFLERYPATQDNATVRDLESLGAAIGIDMALVETPGSLRPAPEAAQRFEAIKTPLSAVYSAGRTATEASLAPLPPELAAFLDSVRPGLDAIRKRLAHGPPPVWARNLEAGFETRIPNYLGLLTLQKVLLLEAREQLQAGREAQAGEILETSWQLNEAMADNNPVLITQLIAQAVIRLQQPVLRSFSKAPAGWPARLLRLDRRSRTLRALRCENFSAYLTSTFDRPIPDARWGTRPQILIRWMLWDYARRLSAMVEMLPQRDVRTFDPEAFEREQRAAIPRWQIIARTLLPNFGEFWPRSARIELEAELTALVLEERERLAAGAPPRPTNRRPSRVQGLSWIYEDLPGATTLHLDGDLKFQEPKPVPLRFTVRSAAVVIP
ncbi:MAG TPA: hypothetical protein VGS07_33950 [Thermoanaerobaculia bacterium]|nr:hypothetical protein [Thermoanaerobaculia bacterium]